ncbi:cytochrome-c peroxidase [Cellvibrio sp.]|uniref:cytochrome-c peroxidase n=1 Tax=Cellvibrio sp. TaxID=1965322 RepID=UPI00396474B0
MMLYYACWAAVVICTSLTQQCVAVNSVHDKMPDSSPTQLGLPVLQPNDSVSNKKLIELGRQLFFDKRLSAQKSVSCATCHSPNIKFTDGLTTSVGNGKVKLTRNAPSLINVAYSTTLFWDGRVNDLESQAVLPITNEIEHGMTSKREVESVLGSISRYREQFRDLKLAPNIESIGKALASYQRTLIYGNSPFDKFMYGNERQAISESAKRGLIIFKEQAKCSSCHSIGESFALFTDQKFHTSPLGLSKNITENLQSLTQEIVNTTDRNHINFLISTREEISSLGRFAVTLDPKDIGKFKTPSLRNVAETAPYMHDGSIESLEEAIELELYNRKNGVSEPVILTSNERLDLLEFLKSLSSFETD